MGKEVEIGLVSEMAVELAAGGNLTLFGEDGCIGVVVATDVGMSVRRAGVSNRGSAVLNDGGGADVGGERAS